MKLDIPGDAADGNPQDQSVCVERWKAAAANSTQSMWGIFKQTGIFVSICRHGFVLAIADMIRSGELLVHATRIVSFRSRHVTRAKYPIAIVNKLLQVYGDRLGIGYDIACSFSGTLDRSSVGPVARHKCVRWAVPSFHGHAHRRSCQLDFHPLYIEGFRLEDMEGCERLFSSSNGVARCTRHASEFHRQQAIVTHFQQWDRDKYAELSAFYLVTIGSDCSC